MSDAILGELPTSAFTFGTDGWGSGVMRPLSASPPTVLHSHDELSVQIAPDQMLTSDDKHN